MSQEVDRPRPDESLLRVLGITASDDAELKIELKKFEWDMAEGAREARERSDMRFERVKPRRKLIV